jgi:hypothetical protein
MSVVDQRFFDCDAASGSLENRLFMASVKMPADVIGTLRLVGEDEAQAAHGQVANAMLAARRRSDFSFAFGAQPFVKSSASDLACPPRSSRHHHSGGNGAGGDHGHGALGS